VNSAAKVRAKTELASLERFIIFSIGASRRSYLI